jgi:thymidine kinase
MEASLLRVQKQIARVGEAEAELEIAIVKTYVSDAMERIHLHGKHALQSFADGDELRIMLMGLKRYTKSEAFNTKNARRKIAEKVLEAGKYCF